MLANFEKITALVAAFTITVVALSASHELGYFAYVGGRFFQTFLTASDYFANSLLWLPFAALTAVGWLNYEWIWKQTPRPVKGRWNSWIMPGIIVSIPALMFIFFEEGPPTFYFMVFIYFWILFSDSILTSVPGSPLQSDLIKLAKIAVPICVGLFTLGYANAKDDLKSFSGTYVIYLDGENLPILRIPLRNFDKGLLARDPSKNTLEFIRWDSIKTVSKPIATNGKTLGCVLFEIWCKPINSPL